MPIKECSTCQGNGTIVDGQICKICKGKGTLVIDGPIIEKRYVEKNIKNSLESEKK